MLSLMGTHLSYKKSGAPIELGYWSDAAQAELRRASEKLLILLARGSSCVKSSVALMAHLAAPPGPDLSNGAHVDPPPHGPSPPANFKDQEGRAFACGRAANIISTSVTNRSGSHTH
jgi:hypothetical protein